MIKTLLIANRGEISCRIIRTARRLNIRTIAVFSEADRDALHVAMADDAVLIGPAPAPFSYLNQDAILAAAESHAADAVHPGYGFLSENAEFAERCEKQGLIFVGPPSTAIRAMGLKDEAKALMDAAGVPVVPGYHGKKQDAAFLKQKAYETGYPVLLKAVAGGGGKGMRRIEKAKDFDAALEAVKREAENAFGDPRMLLEKFVAAPRHIEIQVFADAHGNAVHLFERDCSAQRRHQKVIEEAPAPGMSDAVRAAMGKAAVDAARAVGYVGAGTVEFIADGSSGLRPDGFWFMEMNTRLQVEHPVTEAVTGQDLVEWQIRVASGEALPLAQDAIACSGHAIEARVYAEDPEAGFLPSTGRLDLFQAESGPAVRIDTGVREGDVISPHYDPMIAKVIASGPDRATALEYLREALLAARIAGPKTNIGFLCALLDHAEVRRGGFDTGLIDRDFASFDRPELPGVLKAAAVEALIAEDEDNPAAQWADPWATRGGFQLGDPRDVGVPVAVDDESTEARLTWSPNGFRVDGEAVTAADRADVVKRGDRAYVFHDGRTFVVETIDPLLKRAESEGGEGAVKAPMTGKVVALAVEPGQEVTAGDFLFAVEAMKMEHAVSAPLSGVVTGVHAPIGEQVDAGFVLVELAEAGADPGEADQPGGTTVD
ncbi:MAG: biotin carboxylase N-terminal domain-containing protein [Pseudomonadota bacterium]